jgi:flagellar protein FlaG
MTTEINSLVSNLQPLNQELSGSGVARASSVRGANGPRPMAGSGDSGIGPQPDRRAEKVEADKEDELAGKVSELNALAQQMRRELQFTIEEDSGEMVVKIIDKETNEVIRQIPQEAIVELRKRLEDAAGVIFRDSV